MTDATMIDKAEIQSQENSTVSKKYRAYSEYKDSGVEWLGKIPTEWEITKLKFVSEINMGQSPSSEDCNLEGIGIPFLQGNAEFGVKSPTAKQYCPSPKKISVNGDLLFSVRAPVGALNIADQTYGIGRGLCSLKVRSEKITDSFLWWLLPTYKFQFDSIATGSTFEAVSAEQVSNLNFSLPPKKDQIQIANFLDHETAKIDKLIAKQQKLIALLKEKRQAVISHAVTKGLNPNVKMKDSGVEWLGEVPEHWKVVTLKHLVSAPIIDGPHLSPIRCEDGIPFISAEAISNGKINFDKKWGYISEAAHKEYSKRYCPQRNDLLIVKLGATTGAIAIVETDEPFNVWVPLATIRMSAILESKFVYYLFQSSHISDAIRQSWTFGTQQTLGLGTLSNFRIPVPPAIESANIIDAIEKKVVKFDKVIEKASQSLNFLKERRTALISAAVTGKIDVRHHASHFSSNDN